MVDIDSPKNWMQEFLPRCKRNINDLDIFEMLSAFQKEGNNFCWKTTRASWENLEEIQNLRTYLWTTFSYLASLAGLSLSPRV